MLAEGVSHSLPSQCLLLHDRFEVDLRSAFSTVHSFCERYGIECIVSALWECGGDSIERSFSSELRLKKGVLDKIHMINVRAKFEGRPITTLAKAYSIAPQIDFHISDDGIFDFQGLFLLKEQSRASASLVAVEDAMKNLCFEYACFCTELSLPVNAGAGSVCV